MGKKKKKKGGGGGAPAWMVTFADMMTLMLTFFVLLVSMSVIDERRKLIVLGSVLGTFGAADRTDNLFTPEPTKDTFDPGPVDSFEKLARIRESLWEDVQDDINFQSNKFVDIISITDEVLFRPGETELTPEGFRLLDRILPILLEIKHPILLGGHTSTLREEEGEDYQVNFDREGPDPSWKISLYRVLSIYDYLLRRGVSPDSLRVESFAKFRPRYSDQSPFGRRHNRRVDIVLDKRNAQWKEMLTPERVNNVPDTYRFRDFEFDVDEDVNRRLPIGPELPDEDPGVR